MSKISGPKIEHNAALLPRAGSSSSRHYERTAVGVALANLSSDSFEFFSCLQSLLQIVFAGP